MRTSITIPLNKRCPPPDQVFALATPEHLLEKLGWEIRQLRQSLSDPSADTWDCHAAAFHAFNFAVTAWHLADWVWASAPDYARENIARFLGHKANLGAFKIALVEKYRPLRICQQVANGSKHMMLHSPDPTIRAEVAWEYVPPLAGRLRAGEPLGQYEYHLFVWDRGIRRSAVDVFEAAIGCWTRLLSEWCFIEAQIKIADPNFGSSIDD